MERSNRPFRAELQRKGVGGDTASTAYDDSAAAARHKEVMDAIAALRETMAGGQAAAPAIDNQLIEDYKREVHEAANLKHELQELSDAILNTKKEVAKLHPLDEKSDRIAAMTDELDAVVVATEGATDGILQAVEVIEDRTESLRMHASSEEDTGSLEDISDQVMKIYESCNFQDLTGQRITRVVNTLRFIEERVASMIAALGGEEGIKEVAGEEEVDTTDKRLLHGPTDGETRISQDEIDNLFD